MEQIEKNNLLFILYDGVENSVFKSQILKPLQDKKNYAITLISFENNPKVIKKQNLKLPEHISLIFIKKYPFIGLIGLRYAIKQLKNYCRSLPASSEIIARGPIAGYIALKAGIIKNQQITVQIRGLLADEYQYIHSHKKGLKKIYHSIRTLLYRTLEKKFFHLIKKNVHIRVEVISPALKKHLMKKYSLGSDQITLSKNDIPPQFEKKQIHEWKINTRKKLHIKQNAFVYCYNGSAKPWQCPKDIVLFFKQQLKNNSSAFLLIITQDKSTVRDLLIEQAIHPIHYKIISVEHEQIYPYLAAADAGLLLRKKHIINWVSRPTKVLEYQAVHLNVIHNDTVDFVNNLSN